MYWLPAILILPYFILFLRLYKSLIKIKPFNYSDNPVTFVSVIVASRNEQKHLPALLQAIALQNYSKDLFEVIVIDDHSTDNSFEIAAGFDGIRNIYTINNKGKGKKQALRTGIEVAQGKLIITIDADCHMGINWIRTIAAFYEKNRPDLIICPVQIESVPMIFGRFQELEFLSLQGITAGSALAEDATMCNGANLAFTREVYLNHCADLHDEINSGDDIFLLHSLKKEKTKKILWLESADAMMTTESSPTLTSFLRQRSRWLSKGKAYKDRSTIVLGIVTFMTIVLLLVCLAGSLINPRLFSVLIIIFILKSVPDFLILLNTSTRYERRSLMKWFLPAQLIYPFYVLSVVACSVIFRNQVSSPSQKET
jgi:glycosyltransferase involved in cell wall biosynthesis